MLSIDLPRMSFSNLTPRNTVVIMEAEKHVIVKPAKSKLILRSYINHPDDWSAIISEIMENIHFLDDDVKQKCATKTKAKLERRITDQVFQR